MEYRFTGADVLLEDGLTETEVATSDDQIAALGAGDGREIDARGLILAPAMVDIHGDAFERQIMPRPGVSFPLDAALLETDRQLAVNGIGTAYHALTLSWEPGLRAVSAGAAFLAALENLQPRLRVENRVQLRWETFCFEAVPLMLSALQSPLTPSVAFNDHLSMKMRAADSRIQDRLFEHDPNFATIAPDHPQLLARCEGSAQRAGLSAEAYRDMVLSLWDLRADVPGKMKEVAAAAKKAGAAMLSHDDTTLETRDFFRGLGAATSEFPMALPVAEAARAAGDYIVFGAPNVMRGGSHIGSPGAADMVEAGLCDALASDYYYPAMLSAVGRMALEKRGPLPALWRTVSGGPAAASGLTDRGVIAPGKRADLVLLDWPEGGTPVVVMTMVAGEIAFMARDLLG